MQPKDWIPEECNTSDNTYTNFNLYPKISPMWSSVLACFLLVMLVFHQWMRNQYRDFDNAGMIAWKIQLVLTTISLIDIILLAGTNLIIDSVVYPYPWVAALIRPFYLCTTINVLRSYWKRYILVIRDSTPMVIFIAVYILYFSWMGQRYFSGTK